ncbi:unnamed protein product [Urochloa humidicola]
MLSATKLNNCSMVAVLLWKLLFFITGGVVELLFLRCDYGEISFPSRLVRFLVGLFEKGSDLWCSLWCLTTARGFRRRRRSATAWQRRSCVAATAHQLGAAVAETCGLECRSSVRCRVHPWLDWWRRRVFVPVEPSQPLPVWRASRRLWFSAAGLLLVAVRRVPGGGWWCPERVGVAATTARLLE